MNVIIVDDEPKAIQLITSYLAHFTGFTLVASFRNALKALNYIQTHKVDVIFLDINMPHLSGLSLSKMLPKEIDIVFTTAYAEHAVESYTVNAIDYLLKPISLERFSTTITKLLATQHNIIQKKTGLQKKKERLFIKSGLNTHQISIEDISYLKKDGNYIYYYVFDKKIMVRESVKITLEKLPNHFIQIQKSYIVNLSKIDKINADFVHIGHTKLPIGLTFKANFMRKFNTL